MDLFGPTSVSSISHNLYCLVVTDDFSRFTWIFFLKIKDETSGILRKFITEIEYLKDLKVKIIRCDNGGEFRNKEMNVFCSQKGIKRKFSNARTPQQNGVAERRNRTLIEAARTMVLVNKSQSKTPYELFNGFLQPFVSHVMILNTLDNLGKFEAKGDKCYFIGYSMSSKAFRVHDALLESSSSKPQDDCSTDVPESNGNSNLTTTSINPSVDQLETLTMETPIPTISSPVPTACFTNSQKPSSDARLISKRVVNQVVTPSLDNILTLANWFEDILGLCREFKALMHEKFQMSAMGDILKKFRYSDVRSSNTPMDKENPWRKDGTRKDSEHNVDFHLIVDFIEASPLRYALTVKPTVYVSYIRQFWSTAMIETTEEGTKILVTVDGFLRTVTGSSLRRTLKLQYEEGIHQDRATIAKTSTLPHDSAPRVTSPAAAEGTQELEINRLKAQVKLLKDREGVAAKRFRDDAPIKGRNLDEGEAAAERVSDDTKEMETVLTSMDEVTILASGVAEVPTGSGSIPTASPPTDEVPTGVMYQDNYAKVHKFQTQQRKPWSKKQKRDYYMAVIKSNLGWKVKDFRGMTFEEIEAKFTTVWMQLEDFILMGSKEEVERLKRKGLSLEQESVKKLKTSEEVTKEAKSPDEVPKENVKEMM
nr:hypothetical protein [Tanacetum cinerariifolium]